MPPRRKTQKRRRSKPKMSLIDLAATVAVANAGTQAFFGTNAWNFLTDGWFGNKSAATDNSWELSLNELIMGLTTGNYGISASSGSTPTDMIKRNLRINGPAAFGTALAAPIMAKLVKRVARQPIASANRLLKASGVSQAIGVKV